MSTLEPEERPTRIDWNFTDQPEEVPPVEPQQPEGATDRLTAAIVLAMRVAAYRR
ncbi:hypothetical protein IFY90_004262 [Salmonella enterica]|nr:hypothetical protein [Salmonella enterica]